LAKAILYNPHQNQRKIHNAINNGTEKYYVINIGRQFGKTLLALNQMLFWALNNKGSKIAWVSPVYKQSKKVFEETFKAFAKRMEIYRKVNQSELIIEYITGSTIQFFSAERYDNIRGFTFDYLVCDEFAFMDEKAWTEVLRATVLVKGKKVLLISTPKGKNHFYKMHQLEGINEQYKAFTMTSYDNPMINPSEIDDAKLTLPEMIFRQEYLAEFIDGSAMLFNNRQLTDNKSYGKAFAGIDLGRADDYSVLSIFNEKGEQFYIERWRHSDWATIVKNIAQGLRTNNVQTALVEVNSIGDVIFEMLQKECSSYCTIEPFVTTNQSKKEIVESLIVANQNKEVKFLNVDWLDKELEMFTYEYNPKSRVIKYSATSGFHDDGVMASCLSFHAYSKYKTGRYTII
jgi:hypothetical protein